MSIERLAIKVDLKLDGGGKETRAVRDLNLIPQREIKGKALPFVFRLDKVTEVERGIVQEERLGRTYTGTYRREIREDAQNDEEIEDIYIHFKGEKINVHTVYILGYSEKSVSVQTKPHWYSR